MAALEQHNAALAHPLHNLDAPILLTWTHEPTGPQLWGPLCLTNPAARTSGPVKVNAPGPLTVRSRSSESTGPVIGPVGREEVSFDHSGGDQAKLKSAGI